ncbi:MAG: RecQ family zinc-binding domain-containing protein, partial [Alcanivorax nanhaiticus]
VELKVAGVRQAFRKVDMPASSQELIARLQSQFQLREQRDIDRLQQVTKWAQQSPCYQQALVAYFGESLAEPCGQCSACQGPVASMPARERRDVDLSVIRSVQKEGHAALSTPRQLARFLCGISSPKASRARLARHSAFGSMEEVPFSEVLAQCMDSRH